MRGISSEELINFNPWDYANQQDLLNAILKKCHELNQWMPIDENTPMQKEIWVYDERFGSMRAMFIYGEWRSGDVTLSNINPTHWMPLPPVPPREKPDDDPESPS